MKIDRRSAPTRRLLQAALGACWVLASASLYAGSVTQELEDDPPSAGIPTSSPALATTERWLPAAEVRQVAIQALSWALVQQGCRTEMRPVPIAKLGVAVDQGPVELEARLSSSQPVVPSARMSVWVDVKQQDRAVRSVLVPLNVRAYQMAWVAKSDLPVGTYLSAELLQQVEVDVAAQGQLAWQGDLKNLVLNAPLKKGQYVTPQQVLQDVTPRREEREVVMASL